MNTRPFRLQQKWMVAAVAVLAVGTRIGLPGPAPKADKLELQYQLFQPIREHVGQWLEDGAKADRRIGIMLKETQDEVGSTFSAARLYWHMGRPSKAIALLEELCEKHRTRDTQLVGYPTSIAASLWIGAIARHSGDVDRAARAHAELGKLVQARPAFKSLLVISHMYQAETAWVICGNKQAALDQWQEVLRIPKSPDKSREPDLQLYRDWAQYKISVIDEGAAASRRKLKGSSHKVQYCFLIAATQLQTVGLAGEPQTGLYSGPLMGMFDYGMRQLIESPASPIDRALARLIAARSHETMRRYEKAAAHYRALFESSSFFAPEGGIYWARCQAKLGKKAGAKETLAKVAYEFPGYSPVLKTWTPKILGSAGK